MKRVLVVGCGSIGRRHAANAARLASVTVVDADAASGPPRRRARARRCGLRVRSSRALAGKPDAVVVATPHHTHLPIARAALAGGARRADRKAARGKSRRRCRFSARGRAPRPAGARRLQHALPSGDCGVAPARCRGSAGRDSRSAHYGNYLPDMRPGADYRTLYCAQRRGRRRRDPRCDPRDRLSGLAVRAGRARDARKRAKLSDLDIDVEDYAALALTHRRRRALGDSSRLSAALEAPRLRDRRQRGHAGLDQRGQGAGALPGALLRGRFQRLADHPRSSLISIRRRPMPS